MSVPHDSLPGGADPRRDDAGAGISAKLRSIIGRRRTEQRDEDRGWARKTLQGIDRQQVDAQKPILEMLGTDGEITDEQVDAYVKERRRAGNLQPDPAPTDVAAEALMPLAEYLEDPIAVMRRAGADPITEFKQYPPVHRDAVPSMLGELCDTTLERSIRIALMADVLRQQLLTDLDPRDWYLQENVIADGVMVPFFFLGPTGIVLLWVYDGDWEDDRDTLLRLAQIARRAIERRLPDGRPVSVWFWALRSEPRKTTHRLGPSDEDLYSLVGGGPPVIAEYLRRKSTRWPLSRGIADVVRAASRHVPSHGYPPERKIEDGSMEP